MIDIQYPSLPDEKSWTPPVDDDLYWVSMANYLICQIIKSASTEGLRIRQVQESDVISLISSTNETIQEMSSSIQNSLYVENVPET